MLKLKETKYPKLRILENTDRYHGPKVIALYKHAIEQGADYIFQTDSDGQTNPKEFADFWNNRKKFDGIFGNRTKRGDGKDRALVEHVVCLLLRLFFRVKVPDANAPFRLMKASVLKKYLSKLPEDYNIPNIILTAYFAKNNEKTAFKEISFKPRQAGKNSINMAKIVKIGWRALKDFSLFRKDMNGSTEGASHKPGVFENIATAFCSLALAFIFSLNSPLHPWVNEDTGTDSSVFRTVSLVMQHGGMPYRDSFDHKGPMLYVINWLGDSLSRNYGIWLIELIVLAVSFFTIYRITRLACSKAGATISTLIATSLLFSYFEGGNLTEEYAMPCIAIGLYIFLKYLIDKRVSKTQLLTSGIMCGIVLLLRPNMISVWVVFGVAIALGLIFKKKFKELGSLILWFAIGTFFAFLPVVIWLIINSSFGDFLDCYLFFNFKYSSAENWVTLSSKWSSFFSFCNTSVFIVAFFSTIYHLKANKAKSLLAIYTAYLLLTIVLMTMSGQAFPHYGMILVPALAYPICLIFSDIEKMPKQTSMIVLLIVSAYSLSTFIAPNWINLIGSMAPKYSGRQATHYSQTANSVASKVAFLTDDSDKISVYGNWNLIYILSNRLHATKYSYQFPIGEVAPEIMDDYYDSLQKELPKVIVIKPGSNDDRVQGFLIENKYQLVLDEPSTEDENATAKVYLRK